MLSSKLGQPMHAFDATKIKGEIEVRNAKSGEKIELLNETTVALNEDTLIIADSNSVLAIGSGIANTGVNA
jgi:phenylalanyl-tRNA synthetase beta chain